MSLDILIASSPFETSGSVWLWPLWYLHANASYTLWDGAHRKTQHRSNGSDDYY